MVPVLFPFLMSAFEKTLKIEWKNEGLSVCMHNVISHWQRTSQWQRKMQGHLLKEYHLCSLNAVEIPSETELYPVLSWNFIKWDKKSFKWTYISLISFVCMYIT
jgi:hypothetical protein